MTPGATDRTTPGRQLSSAVAAAINFPVVFATLLLLTSQTEGAAEIGLLNMWSWWGISNGLLGQFGLLTGTLDGQGWKTARVGQITLMVTVGATVIAGLLRDDLFPDHPSWFLGAVSLSGLTYLGGRARAALTLRGVAVHALFVTAGENVLRLVLLAIVFALSNSVTWAHVIAIVAPLIVSLFALHHLSNGAGTVPTHDTSPVSMSYGLLAGVPSLLAYLVVPALSITAATTDLDAYAIASSVARGPLLVAVFAAPVVLEAVRKRSASTLPSWLGPGLVMMAVAQALVHVIWQPDLWQGLIFHLCITGLVAAGAYIAVLVAASSPQHGMWGAAVVASVLFMALIWLSAQTDAVHAFTAWSGGCALLALFLQVASRAPTQSSYPQ